MLTIISPAKSISFKEPAPTEKHSNPRLLSHSKQLASLLKQYNQSQIIDLMSVSEKIATATVAGYKDFQPPFQLGNAKQALFAFTGDVFRHMRMLTYNDESLDFAQDSLRILSGLYGCLRPLDLIQTYRLEMKTRLKTDRGPDLYHFWGNRITKSINQDLQDDSTPALINLASREYARVIDFKSINAPVITIDFKETEDGKGRTIAIFAKWARGMMADFIIQNRITKPEELKQFDLSDYKFSSEESNDLHWIFSRPRRK